MSASERMAQIQTGFLEAKEFALSAPSKELVSDFLAAKSDEFTSVSFEGVSMGLALKSYNSSQNLDGWHWFTTMYGGINGTQIYVGLGWAIAELNIDPAELVGGLDGSSLWRVFDGVGYYYGILRRRSAVQRQLVPEVVSKEFIPAFDQGLGRSFWYNAKGDIARVLETAALFPKDRHPAFWRGLGVAITYVGGINRGVSMEIKQSAKSNLRHLKYGSLMSVLSREKAKRESVDSSDIARCFVSNINPALSHIKECNIRPDSNYLDTIENIETFL